MPGSAIPRSDHLVPRVPGTGSSSPPVGLDGVALPLNDHLVVISRDGAVLALDAGGRRLWEALQAGCTVDDLVEAGVEHGGLSPEMARANVASALEEWRALGLIDAPGRALPVTPVVEPAPEHEQRRVPALDARYLVGDRAVRIRCDDVVLGRVIDAACGAHRIDSVPAGASVEVICNSDGLAVRADDALLASSKQSTRNRALARHRCLTALLETSRPTRKWLGILHASAVGVKGRCILFAGARGSGKSTLAATLVAAGANFVTDDYAPLEQVTWHIWPVPYAPGIKRGSWRTLQRCYPDLRDRPVHRLGGMQIRYLALDAASMAPLDRGLPAAALVLPRFQIGAAFEQVRITTPEAFADLCHARSMLDREPDVLAETLQWIGSVPAYRLTYGDLDRAADWALSLLGAE
jgi:Coenzyme PQQ synthesis protein D (PqqD)